ncbi:MAG: hypothetical protein ABI559_01300 [Chloroflexota bacterium]
MTEKEQTPQKEGSPWMKQLYELFAPVREQLAGYSEQEINDAIDEALKEVRAEARAREGNPNPT